MHMQYLYIMCVVCADQRVRGDPANPQFDGVAAASRSLPPLLLPDARRSAARTPHRRPRRPHHTDLTHHTGTLLDF